MKFKSNKNHHLKNIKLLAYSYWSQADPIDIIKLQFQVLRVFYKI